MLLKQDVEPDRGNGLDLQISQFNLQTSYYPKAKILVVDDTLANLKLLSEFLIDSGFEVMAAKSGKTAIAVLEKVIPDLILLDVVMPEMDGFETCRYLKTWEKIKDIPVIFMTATVDCSDPREKVKGLTLGAVDYISKPIQLEEVLARVKIHLHLRCLTKQLQDQNALLFQEIAEKNLIEKELRKSEERWQLALNGSNDGIWDHNLIDNQLFLSPRCLEMLGYFEHELQHYEQWVMLIHPEDRPGMLDAIQSHLHRETPHYIAEYRMQCKDGTYKWMLSRGQAVWDKMGNPVRRVGSIADITERKVAEEALCQSLTTNHALLNAIPDLMFRCHADGTFLDCKPAKNIETVIPISELIGKNVQEVLPPELAQTIRQAQARAIVSGETQTVEYQLARNGKLYDYEARIVAKDSDELIAIVRDISDRKQAEEALRQSEAREREKAQQLKLALKKLKHTQAQLVQTEKMFSLGRMVAGVAHEINNPTSFIAGNLTPAREYFQDLLALIELYQQTYPNSTPDIQALAEAIDLEFLREDWSKLMDSMQAGVDRIQQIVLSLKSFSRLDESGLKSVDIHESIDNTLLILQSRLRAEGNAEEIEVIKNYGQLPPITCYASQLNQVFMHLLTNAIDALEMQPSPRRITISTEVENEEGKVGNSDVSSPALSVIIRISDNGSGISEDVQRKIFDPFFTTKPVGSGTGLGLSITHQIVVEKHQGKLSCISTLGQGTEFIVKIPVTRP